MISPNYYPNILGGGEISLKLLAESMAKYHDVQVISFDGVGIENGIGVNADQDAALGGVDTMI